jgi:hypothetical protein
VVEGTMSDPTEEVVEAVVVAVAEAAVARVS